MFQKVFERKQEIRPNISYKVNENLEKEGLLEDGKLAVSAMVSFGYRQEDPARPKTRRLWKMFGQWIN